MLTSVSLFCCIILSGESSGGLTECGDHIVTEVFKIHGNGASGGGNSTETSWNIWGTESDGFCWKAGGFYAILRAGVQSDTRHEGEL